MTLVAPFSNTFYRLIFITHKQYKFVHIDNLPRARNMYLCLRGDTGVNLTLKQRYGN